MIIKVISKSIDKLYVYSVFINQFMCNFLLRFIKGFNLILIYYDRLITKSFNTLLDILLYGFIKGYQSHLILWGAGYRFRIIDNSNHFGLLFRLGYSHLIFIDLIHNFRLNLINKLTLAFYNNYLWDLNNKIYSIRLKKKKNIYKKKGLLLKNSIFSLKKSSKLKF